ncbi:MAG: hypothetical protein ACXVA9_07800 [Bdellovibrionales bacterium]
MHMDGRVEYSGAQLAPEYESAESGDPDATEVAKKPSEENFEFGDPLAEIELPPELPDANEPTILHQDLMKESDFSEQEKRYEADFNNDPAADIDATQQLPPPVPAAVSNSQSHRVEEEVSEFGREEQPVDQEEKPSFEEEAAPPPVDPFDIIPEEPAAEVYNPGVAKDSPDLSDIATFGNSDSSTRDGSLRYNLIITGIDTADVRESFREAITDRKLVWDIDQILRSLKNGEVRIPNVPPPKAYMLISRLRNLPVQVRWEQYAISQT